MPVVDSVPFLDLAAVNDALQPDYEERRRIGRGVHYPIACHRQPAYAEFVESLPVAERAAEQIPSLPMFPTLTDVEVDRVCEVLWTVPTRERR
jgi:dTDP-4-amino-4,6-dideoxygalactose transaminase